MVRKIAQGNPRAFIQIMSSMFEKARKSELTPKAQHGVLREYAHAFCESTQGLESYGPTIYQELATVGFFLQNNVHNGCLKAAGSNFMLKFDSDMSFEYARKWLNQAIAYSRIMVDEDTLRNGITKETEYMLSNVYAVEYWLPMRSDSSKRMVCIKNNEIVKYTVKSPVQKKYPLENQISMFGGDYGVY
ncbi:MAG: hypothetical protein E7335_11785 [Clostridiales bacterium]|nr:hypothetical protein [Clostridiales bacterium]